MTYANKLKNVCELKILADFERVEKYKKKIPTLNGENIELEYVLPSERYEADLIIISTKASGLDSAIQYITNFVSEKTIIISLINGISSEEKISAVFPQAKVLRSYFIGHSAIGINENGEKKYFQDGVGKIVFEPDLELETFFKKNNIDYEIANDIIFSQWIKLGVNIILNEPSAIYKCSVGDLRRRKDYLALAKNLIGEVKQVAGACGIKNLGDYEKNVLESAELIADDGKTSMYQDIIAKRKTEIDIFSGEIIRLGCKYGIKTPYNEEIYSKIKLLEKEF